jgi:hypothetical protein
MLELMFHGAGVFLEECEIADVVVLTWSLLGLQVSFFFMVMFLD